MARMGPSMPRYTPRLGPLDVGDLRGDGPVGKADAAYGEAPDAYVVWPVRFHVSGDDAVLPLDETGGVGDVVEDLHLGAGNVDRRGDRRHHSSLAMSSA
jgi:hypothetical protein